MKQLLRVTLFLLIIAGLIACGTVPSQQQTSQPVVKPTEQPSSQTAAPANNQPEKTKAKVKVYYSNADLTNLVEEQQEIEYTDDKEKYEKIMALLGQSAQKGHEALWQNFSYHSITLKNGKLTIDASGENQYNFGSSGEEFAIEALTKSFFQFPEIKEIMILVDGKPTDSLMGHVDISQPLTRQP